MISAVCTTHQPAPAQASILLAKSYLKGHSIRRPHKKRGKKLAEKKQLNKQKQHANMQQKMLNTTSTFCTSIKIAVHSHAGFIVETRNECSKWSRLEELRGMPLGASRQLFHNLREDSLPKTQNPQSSKKTQAIRYNVVGHTLCGRPNTKPTQTTTSVLDSSVSAKKRRLETENSKCSPGIVSQISATT